MKLQITKKLLSIIVLFVMILNQSYAQKTLSSDYAYKVSEPYRVFDADLKMYFSKGNEVLALKLDGKEILIQKFNADKPAFIKEKKYEKKYFPKNYCFEDVLEVDGKFYFFYSSWDGDNDKEQLFSNEIDFATGEFVGSPKLLFQVNGKVAGVMAVGGMGFSYEVVDKFDFYQSKDKKSVLVQYRKKPEVKRDTKSFDIIGLNAFDKDLNKVYGNELTMPYTERRMNNIDYQMDNKGNLYLLTKVFHDDSNDDKKKKKDTEANYHIELFLIKKDSKKIEISKFDNKDKFISKLWLFDSDDYVVCGGFYSNGKGDFDDCDGIVSFKIKDDGTIFNKVTHEIPLEVLNQYETESTKKKNEKKERKGDDAKFSDLELKNLCINNDGSLVLVGEQFFITSHTTSSQSGMRTYYTYHYCDILAAKINADGSLGWMKKIPKNQVGGAAQGGMSYKYFNADNSHYLVFLDNVKNIDLPLDKTPARHADGHGGYLTAVKISDADGALTKGSILNSRDVEDFKIYQFSTNRIVKTSESSFLLEVYKKKKEDIMIKVDLK
ncbi:hypothetical protein [Flavobacterium sp.]|uniref:hypothetical protein n=1 Tax=Flavobacterium sp. TaxID=239 RepID=UPI003D6BE812